MGSSAPAALNGGAAENPGEFALGSLPHPGPGTFTPDQAVLGRAGSAATPFGFGGQNPFAALLAPSGGAASTSSGGTDNARMMQALMAQTAPQPGLPKAVPIQPVNIPPL